MRKSGICSSSAGRLINRDGGARCVNMRTLYTVSRWMRMRKTQNSGMKRNARVRWSLSGSTSNVRATMMPTMASAGRMGLAAFSFSLSPFMPSSIT